MIEPQKINGVAAQMVGGNSIKIQKVLGEKDDKATWF